MQAWDFESDSGSAGAHAGWISQPVTTLHMRPCWVLESENIAEADHEDTEQADPPNKQVPVEEAQGLMPQQDNAV